MLTFIPTDAKIEQRVAIDEFVKKANELIEANNTKTKLVSELNELARNIPLDSGEEDEALVEEIRDLFSEVAYASDVHFETFSPAYKWDAFWIPSSEIC